VDQPVSKAELEFLKDVKEYSNRIFFLQNKADYVNPEDLHESISFSKGIIEEAMGGQIKIYPLSAKLALTVADKIIQAFKPDFVCMYARGRRIPHTHIFLVPSYSGDTLDRFFTALEGFQECSSALHAVKQRDRMQRAEEMLQNAGSLKGKGE
jgi:hypothetical protein